ncbi:MAG: hypothetical protein M0R51_10855 [Clostridia bacterium]|jgi:hypothetical protein|nr:hypothetical protein [Clostridia bacterium]
MIRNANFYEAKLYRRNRTELIIPTSAYIVGTKPLAYDWLSLSVGGSALVPSKTAQYIIETSGDFEGKIYSWDGRKYVKISDDVGIKFDVRPVGNSEKRTFQPISGILSEAVGIYLYTQDLPSEIAPHDTVVYLGKYYMVESVGYYAEDLRILGAKRFPDDKLIEKFPKGIKIC